MNAAIAQLEHIRALVNHAAEDICPVWRATGAVMMIQICFTWLDQNSCASHVWKNMLRHCYRKHCVRSRSTTTGMQQSNHPNAQKSLTDEIGSPEKVREERGGTHNDYIRKHNGNEHEKCHDGRKKPDEQLGSF